MRSFFLLPIVGLFFLASLSAQRVGEKRFTIPYQILPTKAVDPAFTTYSSRVVDRYRQVSHAGLTKLGLKDKLDMRNFRELSSRGHLLVTFHVNRINVRDFKTTSETTETKKKDGTVVKTTRYWKAGTVSMPISMDVNDLHGGLIYESIVGTKEVPVRWPKSQTYKSTAELNKAWSDASKVFYQKLRSDHLNDNFTALAEGLRAAIDVREGRDHFYFEYPKGKKAENAEAWLAHATTAVEVLGQIESDQRMDVAAMRGQLADPIAFWRAQTENYDPGNKKEQRYYHSAAYNLGVVDLALENPAAARERGELLVSTVRWNRDRSRGLSKAAADLEEGLGAFGNDSRHFPLRDLSAARGPENPTYGLPAPIAVEYDTFPGYYLKGEEKIGARVIIVSNERVRVGIRPNVYLTDAGGAPIELNPKVINGFGFGNYRYVVEAFNDKGGLSKRPNFMRVMVDGPKMQLLDYVRSYPDGEDREVELIRTPDGEIISLDFTNVRWLNWKKAFGKLFEDCAGLQQRIQSGDYRRNVNDIAEAIRFYNAGDCAVEAEDSDEGEGR